MSAQYEGLLSKAMLQEETHILKVIYFMCLMLFFIEYYIKNTTIANESVKLRNMDPLFKNQHWPLCEQYSNQNQNTKNIGIFHK